MQIGKADFGFNFDRIDKLGTRDFFAIYFGPGNGPRLNVLRTRFGVNQVYGCEVRLFGYRLSFILHSDRAGEAVRQAEQAAVGAKGAEDFAAEFNRGVGAG